MSRWATPAAKASIAVAILLTYSTSGFAVDKTSSTVMRAPRMSCDKLKIESAKHQELCTEQIPLFEKACNNVGEKMSPGVWGSFLNDGIKIFAPFKNKPVTDFRDLGCPHPEFCVLMISQSCLDLINKNAASTGQTAEEYLRSIVNTCTKAKHRVG